MVGPRPIRMAIRFLHSPLACAQALPYVLVAARRVARLEGQMGMRQRVDALRMGAPLPVRIADPRMLSGMVNLLLPVLPPFGTGRCYRRSLILLNLWSRCGLEPTLRLGIRPGRGKSIEGHVWLTAAGLDTTPGGDASLRPVTSIGVTATDSTPAPGSRPDRCRWSPGGRGCGPAGR